jgi:hypothetical protein
MSDILNPQENQGGDVQGGEEEARGGEGEKQTDWEEEGEGGRRGRGRTGTQEKERSKCKRLRVSGYLGWVLNMPAVEKMLSLT